MAYIVKKPFRPTGTGSKLTIVGDEFKPASAQQARLFKATGHLIERAETAPAVSEWKPAAKKVAAKKQLAPQERPAGGAVGALTKSGQYLTRRMTAADPVDTAPPAETVKPVEPASPAADSNE